MQVHRFFCCIGFALALCSPVQAVTIMATPPTILIRQSPNTKLAAIYVIFSGSLAEMVAAEQAVAKIFEKSEVIVIGASSDISSVDQLKSPEVIDRFAKRVAAVGGPVGFVTAKVSNISGTEITFSITLTVAGTGELAVGEVLIDTNNQLSFSSSGAQSMRIAIRDAMRRFVGDNRIRLMFAR
jgi:hypothetical protein